MKALFIIYLHIYELCNVQMWFLCNKKKIPIEIRFFTKDESFLWRQIKRIKKWDKDKKNYYVKKRDKSVCGESSFFLFFFYNDLSIL